MATFSGIQTFASLMVACILVIAPCAMAALSCVQTFGYVSSCVGYLQTGGTIPESCCKGARILYIAAKTKAERQACCDCLKTASSIIPGLRPDLLKSLPSKCGVSIPYDIGPNTDCSKVQ